MGAFTDEGVKYEVQFEGVVEEVAWSVWYQDPSVLESSDVDTIATEILEWVAPMLVDIDFEVQEGQAAAVVIAGIRRGLHWHLEWL